MTTVPLPVVPPPTDPAAQLQWLVDREAIRDRVFGVASALDGKDRAAYVACFTEDAVLDLPHGRVVGREAMSHLPTPPADWTAQHLFGQIVIDLDGDRAGVRAYLAGTHVFSASDPTDNAHAGGWYDYDLVRTPTGWLIARMGLHVLWEGDRPMIPATMAGGREPDGS